MTTALPVLVGETNPYGTEPRYALFCAPRHSAGARLQRVVLGLRRHRYVELPRYNLCTGPWRIGPARQAATRIRAEHPDEVLVLCGRKVATAFGHPKTAPFTYLASEQLVLLPHPSGLCQVWDEPDAVERARALLQPIFPDLPLGEVAR